MVKGVSRRVVVVDSPDPQLFEQAIFIVRNDAFGRSGVSSQQVVAEAVEAASRYVRGTERSRRFSLRRLPPWAYAMGGAGGIGLLWLAVSLL
ncbi:MAG: hypothetical protein ACI3WR_01145 [Oscillospiraceae bacterium]